jgi:hypothetical protein
MAPVIDPTDQQLRDACERMALRFRWIDSFETVMQDARRSRLVRLAVAHPSAAEGAAPRVPRAPCLFDRLRPDAGATLFDRKRAASGERDDD